MIEQIFATKKFMTQAWDVNGKRLAITKCLIEDHIVIGKKKVKVKFADCFSSSSSKDCLIWEIGYGQKKLKNMSKPLRAILEKLGLKNGVKKIQGMRDYDCQNQLISGSIINVFDFINLGDKVNVTGITKGRGFAGVVKRHGFSGGPRTHGQSDRLRAPGSIGGTISRVWKGQKMAGRYGNDNIAVKNLTVVYVNKDKREIWLSGPVPGHFNSIVTISKTNKKVEVKLNYVASGIELANNVVDKKVNSEKKDIKK